MDSNNICGGRGKWVGTVWAERWTQIIYVEGGASGWGHSGHSNNICGAKKNILLTLTGRK